MGCIPPRCINTRSKWLIFRPVFGQGLSQDNREPAEKIHKLIAHVTVIPQSDGFKLELHGRLALLMQAPKVYPNMRIFASGGRW
ncbi:hypothetical protein CYK37_24415 [Mesorhizobium loti]|nr:hypothetical protein CYK37_24415 [Mesorhizobium loti]